MFIDENEDSLVIQMLVRKVIKELMQKQSHFTKDDLKRSFQLLESVEKKPSRRKVIKYLITLLCESKVSYSKSSEPCSLRLH